MSSTPTRRRLLSDLDAASLEETAASSPSDKKRARLALDAGLPAAAPPADPLDQILGMCRGEIVPRVPNLQLLHFMLVYGHCGGSEGVCMDSTIRVEKIQNMIYEKHVRSMTQDFSSASANNGQSKFFPNDWIDTFCKLMVDVNIGLPRIKALAQTLRLFSQENNGSSSDRSKIGWQLQRDAEAVASMLQSGCAQCYDRRIVDLSSLKHPNVAVSRHFPSSQLFAEGGKKCVDALKKWARHLLLWMCAMYENACYCCFEDLAPANVVLRVPTPRKMGIRSHEFNDWSSVVAAMARSRTGTIQNETMPLVLSLLDAADASDGCQFAECVERVLVSCWKQVAVLNMEVVNILLFYVSYPVMDMGERYVRKKLSGLLEGSWGGDKVLDRLSSPSGPVVRLPSSMVTQRVAKIMQYGSAADGSDCMAISPLVGIRLVQFGHGVIRIIADQSLLPQQQQQAAGGSPPHATHELLQQVFALDGQGIHCLQKVFRWVSQGMVALEEGYRAIDAHFEGYPEQQLVPPKFLAATCRHAFTEAVLRIVHYRCFETGRRFLMDAVHMLLRVAGHDLACRLLKIATCVQTLAFPSSCGEGRAAATHCIAQVVASWHCIMTMTTATLGGIDSSKVFEDQIASETWCADHLRAGSVLARVLDCIKSYVADVAMPSRRRREESDSAAGADEFPLGDIPCDSGNSSPILEREFLSSPGADAPAAAAEHGPAPRPEEYGEGDTEVYSEDESVISLPAADRAPSPVFRTGGAINLPHMYLRSVSVVPVEASSSSSGSGSSTSSSTTNRRRRQGDSWSAGDPTVAAKQDSEGVQVWEYCWRHCKRSSTPAGTRYANLMPLFKPILLYSASMARNMIAVNAFYYHDHIGRALAYQMEASCSQWKRRGSK